MTAGRILQLVHLLIVVIDVRQVPHLLPSGIAVAEHRTTGHIELIILHIVARGLLVLRLVP